MSTQISAVSDTDRQTNPLGPMAQGQDPDLIEEIRPVVQAGHRVPHGPLEHLALELLLRFSISSGVQEVPARLHATSTADAAIFIVDLPLIIPPFRPLR